MLKRLLLLVLPLAIMAGGWYVLQSQTGELQSPSLSQDTSSADNSSTALNNSTNNALAPSPSIPLQENDIASAIVNEISQSNQNATQEPVVTEPTTTIREIDTTTVAEERLSDEEFENLEALMRNDRDLRMQILEQFRYTTDPARAKQLAALLGAHNDPEILQVASELTYSGDPQSKAAGLNLLSRIQPRNNEARNIAIDLLSSESNPAFLISTMNVLAKPARGASVSQRELLSTNLNNLSSHYDSNVRSLSLSLMGRWDKNSYTSRAAITQGLTDTDPRVRSSAAYAIRNIQNPDAYMIEGLFGIAEDTGIKKSTRHAALDALANMNLTGTDVRRYNTAKRNVNRRVVKTGN